ncbi:hypothetical protein bthur0011_59590 [Bacillus thuringiensis serovar huazhongensis BGSC 4BD1]|nr:hypothetical protein bthur0011_59590 [Bacillus thuringiensis serovar huazhongensis BGSC 4BD1]
MLLFLSLFFFTCIPFAPCFPKLLNLQHTALSFPFFFFLYFFCSLLSLTPQLATVCSFSYLFPLTYIPFALCLPYISQLTTCCSFSYLFPLTYIPFALCLPYISQLTTCCSFFSLFLLPTFLLRLAFLNPSTCNSLFSSYLFSLTYILFALCLPYISQLTTRLLFLLPISNQLATRLRYPFPISFNLQQYNLFLN